MDGGIVCHCHPRANVALVVDRYAEIVFFGLDALLLLFAALVMCWVLKTRAAHWEHAKHKMMASRESGSAGVRLCRRQLDHGGDGHCSHNDRTE